MALPFKFKENHNQNCHDNIWICVKDKPLGAPLMLVKPTRNVVQLVNALMILPAYCRDKEHGCNQDTVICRGFSSNLRRETC